jgi:hypothetical protein
MSSQEVSDWSGVAWQKFSVGPASKSLLNFPDDIPGREPLLSRDGGASDVYESGYLGDFQIQLAVQQKMSDKPTTGVITAGLLEKIKCGLQNRQLMGCPL